MDWFSKNSRNKKDQMKLLIEMHKDDPAETLSLDRLMSRKVAELPEGKWIRYSQTATACVGGLSACFVYALFRRSVKLYEGFVLGNVVIGLASGVFSTQLRSVYFQPKILTGQLKCEVCAITQGGILQTLTGFVLPSLLSFAFVGVVADKYKYMNIPSFGITRRPTKEFSEFWIPKFRCMRNPMVAAGLIQLALGAFLARQELQAADHLRQNVTKDDIRILWQNAKASIQL